RLKGIEGRVCLRRRVAQSHDGPVSIGGSASAEIHPVARTHRTGDRSAIGQPVRTRHHGECSVGHFQLIKYVAAESAWVRTTCRYSSTWTHSSGLAMLLGVQPYT